MDVQSGLNAPHFAKLWVSQNSYAETFFSPKVHLHIIKIFNYFNQIRGIHFEIFNQVYTTIWRYVIRVIILPY